MKDQDEVDSAIGVSMIYMMLTVFLASIGFAILLKSKTDDLHDRINKLENRIEQLERTGGSRG